MRTRRDVFDEACRDRSVALVLETEGWRGAAERGWLGASAQEQEFERQREEYEEYRAAREQEDHDGTHPTD